MDEYQNNYQGSNQGQPYGQPGPYGQPQQYGQQTSYGQQVPYSQPDPYGQPQQYGQQAPYSQPDPYGQPQQYGQQSPYGQPDPYGQPQSYGQQPFDPYAMPGQLLHGPTLTKKEFLNHSSVAKLKKNIKGAAIASYIIGGFNILMGFFANSIMKSVYGMDMSGASMAIGLFFFGLLVIGFGVGVHVAQSRVCACGILGIAILNTISTLIYLKSFGGWLIIFIGISAVSATFAFHKAWNEYQSTGAFPVGKK